MPRLLSSILWGLEDLVYKVAHLLYVVCMSRTWVQLESDIWEYRQNDYEVIGVIYILGAKSFRWRTLKNCVILDSNEAFSLESAKEFVEKGSPE